MSTITEALWITKQDKFYQLMNNSGLIPGQAIVISFKTNKSKLIGPVTVTKIQYDPELKSYTYESKFTTISGRLAYARVEVSSAGSIMDVFIHNRDGHDLTDQAISQVGEVTSVSVDEWFD